jgi:type I restriction enzyme S subunit
METLQPKLRFPKFKRNWETKFFKEIYSFRSTNSLSREKLNYEKGLVKNIHYGDIHSKFNSLFKAENEIVPFINEDIQLDKIPAENYLKIKDLIIADASEDYDDIGKCIEIIELNEVKVLAGLHTFVARPDLFEMSTGFGNYLLKSDYSKIQIKTIAQGTKVLSLSTTRLSDIKVNIPSLPEQTKIANFLSGIDEKINLLKEKKSLLEEYKKGIMQKIFNQEIRFKDDNGKDFEVWEEKSLGSLCNITTGKLDANAMVEDGEFRFYTCAKDYYRIDKYAFDTEALLISGNGANVGYIHYYKGKFNAYQRTYILDGFKENIFFIKYFLQMYLPKRIKGEKNDGNTPYIVLSTLSEMDFLIPSLLEQTKIANFLSSIDEKIELVNTQIKDTQEYKKGLLQQMFV